MTHALLIFQWYDAVAAIAATLGLSAYLRKNQTSLKIQMGIASQVWAIYFFLLGLTTAELIQIGTGLRTWLSLYIGNKPQLKIPYLILVVTGFSCAMVFTWQGAVSLLPTLAAVNSTIAYLFGNKKMRLMFLGSSVFSFTFAILIQSPLLLALECIAISINLIAIKRIHQQEKCV